MNKIANKVITLIITAIMVLAFMPDMYNVWAAGRDYKQGVTDIAIDQEYDITLNIERSNVFHVSPDKTSMYKVHLSNYSFQAAPSAQVYEYIPETGEYTRIAWSPSARQDTEYNVLFTGEAGKDYYIVFTMKYDDYDDLTCKLKVLEDNSVRNIEFIPAQKTVYKENDERCGEWKTDTAGERYFHYNIPEFHEGDKLIATSDEETTTYIYDEIQEVFYPSKEDQALGKEEIATYDTLRIKINDKQKETHWNLGKENYYTISMPMFASGTESNKIGVEIISNVKANNPMKASGRTSKVKYSKLKKKTQKIKATSAFKISGAKGIDISKN